MTNALLEQIRHALRADARLAYASRNLILSLDESGAVVVDGEVMDVMRKKLALERITSVPDVSGLVDRLRVRPALPMSDPQIAQGVCRCLRKDDAFADCAISQERTRRPVPVQEPDPPSRGRIRIRVREGVVELDGAVPSLSQKRLAGVLPWWIPGSRDVVNGLAVDPPQGDSDESVAAALRAALEKDPCVDATQIQVRACANVVTLEGVVSTSAERKMAELDAWYVLGVDFVENRLQISR